MNIVPATIRNWEKAGLFVAVRKSNNYRVYSLNDIEYLKKIKFYSLEQKMSSIAIKNILQSDIKNALIMSDAKDNQTTTGYSKKFLSSKWKESREKLGLTLEDVSRHVGISVSYLSKLENCQGNISLNMLNCLANFYGGSILDFFNFSSSDNHLVKAGAGNKARIGIPGVQVEQLIAQSNHLLHPVMFFVEPNCGPTNSHQHTGEEFIYLISGTLQVILNHKEQYQLEAGDSLYFRSSDFHSWKNNGVINCQMIWVHSPIEPSGSKY